MALVSAAVLLLFLVSCSARDFTFTFKLGAGKSECFYDYIHEGAFLEVEFQVIEGGDLDINFFVNGPNQASLVMDPSSTDGLHAIDIKTTGEHEICLDNSYSRFTDKMVFVDIIIDDDSGEKDEKRDIVPYQLSKEAVVMDMKVQDLTLKLDSLAVKLDKMMNTQNFFRARESRHRHTLDSNSNRVLWWSLLECSVIVAVGMIQVFVIRSLFSTRRKDRIRT